MGVVRNEAAQTRAVIKRMIEIDRALIVVEDPKDDDPDSALLQVHPNFAGE